MSSHAEDKTRGWTRADAVNAVTLYAASCGVVFLGVLLGLTLRRPPPTTDRPPGGPLDAYFRFDGQNYESIAVAGYHYDPRARSTVAFFPIYPLTGRGAALVLGWPVRPAMLLVSHVALAAALVTIHRYARERKSESATLVVGVVAFFPPTMFFHMAYSESLFLALTALALLGIHRGWPAPAVAAVVGLATGTRPVGLALVPLVVLYAWRRTPHPLGFCARAAYLVPLACSGLLVYSAYQWAAFGEPLAFARTQEHWRSQEPGSVASQAASLLTLEPVWGAYCPTSPRYWARFDRIQEPIYSLIFLNPLVFTLAAVTVVWGAATRQLNAYETLAAAGLLLIPYVTRAHDNSMFSMARFSAVALPCYLVWGAAVAACPQPVRIGLFATAGYFLGVFAALFAAGQRYY